jgi:hypothetical protein
MSTPSKSYVCISEYTELAKFVAEAESFTATVPRSPPIEMITFLPAACLARTSALNWSTV